ncbi:MoaD/ThiS family protein [Mycolicibacterium sp.]|uniref:MoaD/ThiS family protein n=1 Tax=Mycolicibacterium sp. TaxID=2320850 RepID=UPI003D0BD976
MQITIRYFAAARAAAGTESETLQVPAGVTVADVVDELKARDPALATVLARCSYLRDGVAVRDTATALGHGHILDVLPPFAGG